MPLWLQVLLAVMPAIPQTAEEIGAIFAPHAGTDTGTKIVQTFGVASQLVQGAAQFATQHAAAQLAPSDAASAAGTASAAGAAGAGA